MKFSLAWAGVAAQNVTLKAAVAGMGVCLVILSITNVKLALRKPLLIERACISTVKSVTQSNQHTPEEMEAFLREAIPQRFNSDSRPIPGYLSSEEESLRAQEQKELGNRGMTQKVIINSVRVKEGAVSADADRLISVGVVRSAFPFPLSVTVSTTDRNEGNPYGLIVSKITIPKDEGAK